MYAADSMLVLSIVFMMSVNPAISYCPTSGIYLLHRGHCYHNGSYFWDSRIKGSRIDCKFPVALLSGGEWIGPAGKVPCPGERANLKCSFYQGYAPSTRISLYLPYYGGKYLDASGDGWYKCCLPSSCSDPNTNIIFANIFRFAQIESFYAADLPSDMTVYPQKYKLNCTKIGHKPYTISIKLGNTSLANYTNCNDGNNSPCPGDIINGDTNTVRYTFDITWDGRTATIGSSNNLITGDQMYKCFLDNNGGPNRTRTLTIKVPDTAPSSLTVINKTATTITVSWTPLDSSDADGYVVNVTNDTNATVQTIQVEGNTNNTITLDGLDIQIIYTVTVRAYQQLLGPAGTCTISLQDLLGIDYINWTLVSSITQLNSTQYRIDCITTTDTNSSADAYWLVNGVMKSSSMYELIDDDRTNNTLLIYPDPLGVSLTVSCIAIYGGVTYSEYVTLDASNGPPINVKGFILNSTSIKVNWTNSSETNGY
uniref:Fibronectin type-III domain-containing protein n=1 Tax=Amphimedon queenslandica TaxID=400682 RepID=A0A1X7TJI3_AMPQE